MIPHELLFCQPSKVVVPAPGRTWRIRPNAYIGLVQAVLLRTDAMFCMELDGGLNVDVRRMLAPCELA